MPRHAPSLFGEILDWMLTPLLVLWPIALALTWAVAQELAERPFDRALAHNVQVLAQFIQAQPGGGVHFSLPQPVGELLRSDGGDIAYYQVLDGSGRLVAGEPHLPPPPASALATPASGIPLAAPQLRDGEFHGLPMRIAWLRVAIGGGHHALVQVAEAREKRRVLATEIIKGVMLPQLSVMPLTVLLVWLALARGLRPLAALQARIRRRRPDDLSALDTRAVPQELVPLVLAINGLLKRLNRSIQTQKRFLADAAHQLKTPLAGLRMQAELALREDTGADDVKASLEQIGHASARATHTVQQLLALARAESGLGIMARQSVDLAQLAREVVLEAVPAALAQHIDLGYEGPDAGDWRLQRHGNAVLLKEMLRNLVDNAMRYAGAARAPGDACVTVQVDAAPPGGGIAIRVCDNGPGIPKEERQLIFQPFWRALGSGTEGTGLGLNIVLEIARQHHASVHLHEAQPGATPPGACFAIRFK